MDGLKFPNLWGGIMERLKLGSVLDPIIAVLIVIATLFAVVAIFARDDLKWLVPALFIILVIAVIIFFAVYIVWTLKDPDKLRTSEHEIRKFEIAHNMGEKGNVIPAETLVTLPNTTTAEPKKITEGKVK